MNAAYTPSKTSIEQHCETLQNCIDSVIKTYMATSEENQKLKGQLDLAMTQIEVLTEENQFMKRVLDRFGDMTTLAESDDDLDEISLDNG